MTDITVTTTAEDPASKSLQVTVSVDRVRDAEARAVSTYAKRVRLPGFRAGKAPEAVVRKRLHQEIRQYVLEDVIRAGWEEARSSQELKPLGDPSVRNVKFEDGQPLEFELFVEVRPEIVLNRTSGFTMTRTVTPVTAEHLEEQLQSLREKQAAWLPVEGTKPAPGQMVRVDVTSLDEGADAAPQPYTMVLGDGRALPALEEAIMNLSPGESAEADIRFPEDHADESKRGQSRRVRIELHEVKLQELPPLDDGFAASVGEFADLAALKAALTEDLARDAAREADSKVRESLLQQIVEANQVPAPESLVHRLMHGLLQSYGIPHEQYDAFAAQFRPVAETQVRRDLVLTAVAEAQELRATEGEVDERVAAIAATRGVPVGQVYASLEQAKRLPEIERSLTEEKAWAWLLAQSTVTEATS
ncbi:MAG: trigger factor [Gemmatimonadota bacterium]|nr:trigger factor [Gemmatimonadota bacterium]